TVTAGTASGATLPLTITGLTAGQSATLTVTVTRTGYATGSATVTSTALIAALVSTFNVNVTNYSASHTWWTNSSREPLSSFSRSV
ncbi:MAG: hypothetical protein RI895_1337, partial [Actinomycetota bacterium]